MKLSVAMITYNHERFIGQALESVLTQKVNFEYEIVIGEDCSTDSTRAVVLDFQRRYPDRIVVLSRARNIGAIRNFAETIAVCHSQYLAILEGDDYWTCTNKLQRQVDFLDSHPDWAICCSRAEVRNEPGILPSALRAQTGTVFPGRPESTRPDVEDVSGLIPAAPRAAGTYTLEDLLPKNFIPTCTVVYRWGRRPRFPSWILRSTLGDLPRHAIVAGQKKIELLDECTAVYRIHEGAMWSFRDPASQSLENARMLARLSRHLGGHYANILGPIVASSYLHEAITARQRGSRMQTGRHLISCIRNGGFRLGTSARVFAGLAAYTLFGSGYKVFSRASNSGNDNLSLRDVLSSDALAQGTRVVKKLVQRTLKKFGLRLVRDDVLAQATASPSASNVGLDCFFAALQRLGFHPKHIVDIGANRGSWTRKALTYFPEAHYTLVEPQDHLKVHIQDLLDRGYKITWINAGAANKSGLLPFTISYRDDSSTFDPVQTDAGATRISVPVMNLNEIVSAAEAPPPEMVKIDAEGFDLKVLAGASDLLGKTDVFFVEVTICCPGHENTIARVVRWMDEAGYRVVDITDINRSPKHGVAWLCELAFLRNASPLFANVTSYE